MTYQARLHNVIPGGAHTYSRGSDQFPSNAPAILERGEGAYVWDVSGNRYLDYGMALRSVTLGYAHPQVNRAAIRQIENGNNLTRASVVELEAAEMLVDLIPSIDMVKFAKNGSNATTAAIKIARAYTGKQYVCIPRQHPFFSFDDWFIGSTVMPNGVVDGATNRTLLFDYNDIDSLTNLFAAYPGQIAAVMLEPATVQVPYPYDASLLTESLPSSAHHFLVDVANCCKKEGALFILDEMITGFRWNLLGGQHYFGVEPDICTFGKGMANGFSVAAVAGKKEIMSVGAINKPGAARTFLLSTTHGGEMSSLGAFVETLKIYKQQDVCQKLWGYGLRLRNGLNKLAKELDVADYFSIEGPAISPNYVTRNIKGETSLAFRTLFAQEMIKNGVLMPWIALTTAHGNTEYAFTIDAASEALKTYKQALSDGVERFLHGSSIKPVFRPHNYIGRK